MRIGRSCSPYHDVSPGANSCPRSGRTPRRVKVPGVMKATVTRSGTSPSVMTMASLVE
jgi:hypothetical protein